MGKKAKLLNRLLLAGCVFYASFLLWNILFKYVSPLELFSHDRFFSRTLNLIPFNDLLLGNINRLDIFGNILLFIPLGIYTNLYFENASHFRLIFGMALLSITFEVLQYVFAMGASDITDVIYNTFGGLLGLGIYSLLRGLFKTDEQLKMLIAIGSIIVMIAVSAIVTTLIVYN